MSNSPIGSDILDSLRRTAFDYFLHEANPSNGLIVDKTQEGCPSSIAAVGLGLSSYPVAVERGLMTRDAAIQRTLLTLHFFAQSEQSASPHATGYKGFYYHFLDMTTGQRAWECELSTIDTGFLLAGMLTAAAYFQEDSQPEREIRRLAESLYRRVDWQWAQNGGATLSHGWDPKTGFLPYHWQGYDEALFLYVLALGSPTHPIPPESYTAWASTYEWRRVCGQEYLFSGPFFTHQISHLWIDLRGIQDHFMRQHGIDYFENSHRAAYAQRQYAIDNLGKFKCYGPTCWGITASDGPGPATCTVDGRQREFFGYVARGIPDGPDDGTIAPWATVASLPFAPEITLHALQHFGTLKLREQNPYGFKATFNATYPDSTDPADPAGLWVSPFHYGLNQGPIILMIENYQSGLIWRLLRQCPHIVTGLRHARFRGGWLG